MISTARALPLLLVATGLSAPAQAAGSLALKSDVFVERTEVADGNPRVVLAKPDAVVPGDRLVFVLQYRNVSRAAASGMVVSNPMPQAVAYQDAEGGEVSVDGGKSWGTLSALRIRTVAGAWRTARPDDVTHVRWQLAGNVPAGAGGKLRFRGTVR